MKPSNVTPNTATVASRIDTDSKAKLEQAAEECDLTLSAYLEPIIEKHINQNPNDLRALNPPQNDESRRTGQSQQDKPLKDFIDRMLEDLE